MDITFRFWPVDNLDFGKSESTVRPFRIIFRYLGSAINYYEMLLTKALDAWTKSSLIAVIFSWLDFVAGEL